MLLNFLIPDVSKIFDNFCLINVSISHLISVVAIRMNPSEYFTIKTLPSSSFNVLHQAEQLLTALATTKY
jgi:hypothetical protein